MTVVLIVLVVVVVAVVVALVAANPGLKKREVEAVTRAKAEAGGDDAVLMIDSRVTGMGTKPEEAGGLRGMGVLALSGDALVFVTWKGPKVFRIERGSIDRVETESDPTEASKLTLHVRYAAADGEATALFRVADPMSWLEHLPYDGSDGGPAATAADAEG